MESMRSPGLVCVAALLLAAAAPAQTPAPPQVPPRPPPSDGTAEAIAGLRAALAEELKRLQERIESIDRQVRDASDLARHLARRVEYLPGSKNPADRIPIVGPFVAGRTYLVVRQGTSAVESYTVIEIFGNGWLLVRPTGENSPLFDRREVYLNADQIVLASPQN